MHEECMVLWCVVSTSTAGELAWKAASAWNRMPVAVKILPSSWSSVRVTCCYCLDWKLIFCDGSWAFAFALAGLSDKLDFLDEEQTSSKGNKKGGANQRTKKGWDQKRKIFNVRIFFFFFICEARKLFELILVKSMSRCLSVLRDNCGPIEWRLKGANFCLFNKRKGLQWLLESLGRYMYFLLRYFVRQGF